MRGSAQPCLPMRFPAGIPQPGLQFLLLQIYPLLSSFVIFFFFCTNYVQRGVVFIFFSGKKINKQKPWAMAAGDVLCAGCFFFTPRAVG